EIYGTIIFLGLVAFFFLMQLLGLLKVVELRLLNLLIFIAAIYYALKQHERTHSERIKYFKALRIGVAASFIGISTFALFLFFYIKINPEFLETLKEDALMGETADAYIASFSVWVEGTFAGLFSTFLIVHGMRTR